MKFFNQIVFCIIILQTMNCSFPKKPQQYWNECNSLEEKAQYEAALELMDDMINHYPQMPTPHFFKANIYYKLKKYNKSKNELFHFLQKNNEFKYDNEQYSSSKAYHFLALIYEKQNPDSLAFDLFHKAIKSDSTNADSYRSLSIRYSKIGDYKRAVQYVNKAIQFSKQQNLHNLFTIKFDVLYELEDYNSLIELLDFEIKNTIDDSLMLNSMKEKLLMYYKFGKFYELVKESNHYINQYPKSRYFFLMRGLGYLGINKFEKAVKNFNEIYRLDNHQLRYNLLMILSYTLMGKKDFAKIYIKKIKISKEELLASEEMNSINVILDYYPPHKKAFMDFIESQPE